MNYAAILPASCVDFEGWSTVLQVTGCSHGCEGCFNTSIQNPNTGKPYTIETEKELLGHLSKPYIDNLVLQGGSPLHKRNFPEILRLCKFVKYSYPEKKVVLFTGYRYDQVLMDEKLRDILPYIDIMVDGRFEKDLKSTSTPFRGSSNQEVIDVVESLRTSTKVLHKIN